MAGQDAPTPDDAGVPSTPTSEPSQAGSPPEESRPRDEAEEADKRVTELEAQVAKLEDQRRRALADLDNLRKRVARDMELQRAEERARMAAEWLPVLDHLDLALQHAEADPGTIVEGLRAVRDQAVAVLTRLGFPRHDDTGARFDPARHEAVGTVPNADVPEGTIVDVRRPGYGDDERQLRPAAVVVATRPG